MVALIFSFFLTATVLGNQDFRLTPLDPRTVVPPPQLQQEEQQLENNKLTINSSLAIIDFGIVRPTNPVLRQQTLQVVSSNNHPFTIVAFEDHPLRQSSRFDDSKTRRVSEASPLLSQQTNDIIPDTSCDSGNCRETVGSLWDNPLAYGFGYSLDGLFQQFANQEAGESKQTITEGNKQQQFTINYKVNVPKTQPATIYSNTITYIIVPNY